MNIVITEIKHKMFYVYKSNDLYYIELRRQFEIPENIKFSEERQIRQTELEKGFDTFEIKQYGYLDYDVEHDKRKERQLKITGFGKIFIKDEEDPHEDKEIHTLCQRFYINFLEE